MKRVTLTITEDQAKVMARALNVYQSMGHGEFFKILGMVQNGIIQKTENSKPYVADGISVKNIGLLLDEVEHELGGKLNPEHIHPDIKRAAELSFDLYQNLFPTSVKSQFAHINSLSKLAERLTDDPPMEINFK